MLNRGHHGLGLSLSGGSSENKPIEIIGIHADQPAAQSGQLRIGDVLLSINDVVMHNRNVRVTRLSLSAARQRGTTASTRTYRQSWVNRVEMSSLSCADPIHWNTELIWSVIDCHSAQETRVVFQDQRSNGSAKSNRPGTSKTIISEQQRLPKDASRDLPPKSPASRRHAPTKPKRGEVIRLSPRHARMRDQRDSEHRILTESF